jgi:hypothetical protein
MTTITHQIKIYSEEGDRDHPSELEVRMDGSKPECPLTFWVDGKAVFSMGSCEVHEFCKELSRLDCS